MQNLGGQQEAQQGLPRSEERFRALAACSPVGILLTDTQGHCTYTNRYCQEICGFTAEEALGDGWARFVHVTDRDQVLQEWAAATSLGQAYARELRLVNPQTGERWARVRFAPLCLEDGTPIGYVGTVEDLTEQKHAEEQLRLLNDQQALLHEENQTAREAAAAALRTRDEFLFIASHELRNPLAGLKGTAQLLRRAEQRGQLDADRLDRYLATIERLSAHLAVLAEDLLDASRLQHGTLPLRPRATDLAVLVREAVARQAAQTDMHRFLTHVAAGIYVATVDSDRIEQIVTNLLDNAVKYSPDGGDISVELRPEAGGILLRVGDPGIGLPPTIVASIFEPFGRAPNAAERNIPGLGLGLYICRRIAEQHGGRLWAESAGEQRGTTVSLWLPPDVMVDGEPADG
jgi:PAS domain S-box-containing protein